MVRILYGVAGEGMGHAMRSRAVIEHLQKKHQIKVVSASRSYKVLRKYFDCEEIDYFKIVYRNNTAANVLTALNNVLRAPLIIFRGLKIGRIIRSFKPDIIITDFEPLVDYYAAAKGIPVISIDNQHLISEAEHGSLIKGHWLDKLITTFIIKSFIVKSNRKLVTVFFEPSLKRDKNVLFINPLLRKEIINLTPKKGKHVLVYQTSTSNDKLLRLLEQIPEQFIVYGFNTNKEKGNLHFKDANEGEFYKDLAECKAVVTNGGFTLISEALYLHKPILSFPVRRQFEQILNALYLQKLGYGKCAKETNKKALVEFFANLKKYERQVKAFKRYNPKAPLQAIEQTIKSLS